MSLDWSVALQSLAVVAALTAGYVVLVRRRADAAAALAAGRSEPGRGTGWRRHVPIGLSLAALAVLGIALARPEAALGLPRREGT
ncbi:MAG: ABC transporter ATP-binding protein, partial [Actinomycetota bacterium]|nr:ABC transporter ATP-binding protein [Actinomycetota bacterium]